MLDLLNTQNWHTTAAAMAYTLFPFRLVSTTPRNNTLLELPVSSQRLMSLASKSPSVTHQL